jgi:hypothetical protein
MQANNGLLSFASATKAASDFVTQLYAPVFSRIDPEEVGARARSMKIATDYGQRLSAKSQNLKPHTLRLLSETYSSHSFVIDHLEAETMFHRVRMADENERALVTALGRPARFEMASAAATEYVFQALSDKRTAIGEEHGHHADTGGASPENGANPEGADGTPVAEPARKRGRRASAQNGNRLPAGEPH